MVVKGSIRQRLLRSYGSIEADGCYAGWLAVLACAGLVAWWLVAGMVAGWWLAGWASERNPEVR